MPIVGDVDPYRIPADVPGPVIEDPTVGPHKGGGGGIYNPGAFFAGGGGGGASGFFGDPNTYSSFAGFSPAARRRLLGMGGGVSASPDRAATPSIMVGGYPGNPAQRGAGTGGSGSGTGGAAPWATPGADNENPYDPQTYWQHIVDQYGFFQPGTYDALAQMIMLGMGQGNFDPNGNPQILDAINKYWSGKGAADENAAALQSDLSSNGQDFYGRNLARIEARSNAANNAASEASNYRNQQRLTQQQLQDAILQWGLGSLEQQRGFQNENANRAHDQGSGWGNFFGGLGSAAGGILTGGAKPWWLGKS